MLKVEFASARFTDSESSGFVEVIVRLTGGASITPITVTVTPTEQSPVSAKGKLVYIQILIYGKLSYYDTGSGVDFYSNPFNITINAGATESRGNVSVNFDSNVEEQETFSIVLVLVTNDPQITLGRDVSEGLIIDSTGN